MKGISLSNIPSRIAALLAGFGIAGGLFSAGQAEAGFRKVPESYQEVKAQIVQSGPTLLFSDSPEMVCENGILYRDVIQGEGRVFFHHTNEMENTRKLSVLMRPVERIATVTWGCRGIGDPDKLYYISARKGQTRYFTEYKELEKKARKEALKETRKKKAKVNPKKKPLTDYSFYGKVADLPTSTLARGEFFEVLSQERNMSHAGVRLKPKQLLTGLFDFYASQPVEIIVMMSDTAEDIEHFSKTAKQLPMDEHPLRGTYEKSDLTYIIKEPVQMKWYQQKALCMASSDDGTFLRGVDKMTGKETENHGNYGVVYHVQFSAAGEHPVNLGINPWGGEFCGAGLLLYGGKAELTRIPHNDEFFGRGDEIDDIFEIDPDHKKVEAEFVWSPPGASNLPVRVFWSINRLKNSKKY